MKKLIALLLAFVMIFALTACTQSGGNVVDNGGKAPADNGGADKAPADSGKDDAPAADDGTADFEPVVLKWSMATAVDHQGSIITQEICDNIYERTDGKIKIELHVANELGTNLEVNDMVRMGSVFGTSAGYEMVDSYAPGVNGWLLPFTWENVEDYLDFCEQYAMDEIWNDEILAATGVRTIGFTSWGARHLTSNGEAPNTPEDMNGQLIRTVEQPVYQAYGKALGGNPVPVAWAELYMALQTGVADAEENPISNIVSAKLYEVQDNLVLTGHAECVINAFVSDAVWQTLPAAYQDIIEEEFLAGYRRIAQECLADEEDILKELEGYGMNIVTKDEFDYDAFVANADKVIEEEFGAASYQSWRDFNKIAKDWIAENK